MTNDRRQRLEALKTAMAALREARLAELRQAAEARSRTLAMLQRIERRTLVEPGDVAAHCAQSLHAQWQERQRRHLNLRLAAETAAWLTAREKAATAVGRDEVMGRLIRQQAARRR